MRSRKKFWWIVTILVFTFGVTWSLLRYTKPESTTGLVKRESIQDKPIQNEPQSNTSSDQDFEALAARAIQALPNRKALAALSESEIHHTPRLLLQAAQELGHVADALAQRLEKAQGNTQETTKVLREGITFYRACAGEDESPETIRALCYLHYRELKARVGESVALEDRSLVPERVASLAQTGTLMWGMD